MFKKKVYFLCLAALLFSGVLFCQSQETSAEAKFQEMKETLLNAFHAQGDKGIESDGLGIKDQINNPFIVWLAESGVKEKKEELLTIALLLAQKGKNEKTLADVYYQMGEYYRLTTSNLKESSLFFDKALLIYQKLNDSIGLGKVYRQQGTLSLIINDTENALNLYDKALAFFEKEGYRKGIGSIYGNKGILHFKNKEKEKAFQMLNQAIDIFERDNCTQEIADAYYCKSNIYLALSVRENNLAYRDKELEAYQKALPLYQQLKDEKTTAELYMRMVAVYRFKGNHTESLKLLDKVSSYYEKTKDFLNLGEVFCSKGIILNLKAKPEEAIKLLEKSIFFYKKANNLEGQIAAHEVLAAIYFKIGPQSKASEHLEKKDMLIRKSSETSKLK